VRIRPPENRTRCIIELGGGYLRHPLQDGDPCPLLDRLDEQESIQAPRVRKVAQTVSQVRFELVGLGE
jgi:hypothetical protein